MESLGSLKFFKKILLAVLLLLGPTLIFTLGFIGFKAHKIANQPATVNKQEQASTPTQNNTVLGERTPEIFVATSEDDYGIGGMMALSSTAEPSVKIGAYNASGTAEVSVYEANIDVLLDYLTHDKDGKQIKKNTDITNLTFITTVNHPLNSGYGNASKLLLPIGESGIWLLRIKYGQITQDNFIVRSNIGVLVKEGDNEYIFWGQNFKSGRSINDGSVKIYNLQDTRQEISSTSINNVGIAKASLTADADIALVEQGTEKAIVPINLTYLNSNYYYNSFLPKQKQTKYFVFTDRPLYRPGDNIYFKSILRDDDDVRYTIPTGQALVKIYNGWNEEDVVFEKNYVISSDGTVNGEYKLPANAKTGYYRIVISTLGSTQGESSFDVEFFRKPEYSIDIFTEKTELVAGDKSSFTITGNYFSGQPISGQKINYTIYSNDFYEYEYLLDKTYALNDDYRYGYWGGSIFKKGEATTNKDGKAEVDLDTKITGGKNEVFSIEAEFDDGSGNPSFARKNVLVYAGEYDIYRQERSKYVTQVGTELSLPVKLVSHRNTKVEGIKLTAKIHRENWVSYQEPDKKYPSYRQEQENLSTLTAKTDASGNATFAFIPQKVGSYQITTEGKDQRNNLVSKTFYSYVTSKDQPYYWSEGNNDLTIRIDKQKYLPTDKAVFSITSTIPDRDVFLSLDRERVNRFQIVHMNGKNSDVEVSLTSTDIPNIIANVSSFSSDTLDTGTTNVIISSESKKLRVNVTPNSKKLGPSENISVDIETKDTAGNPTQADVALWAVDKAIFELADQNLGDIFDTFWSERYDDTQKSHSLKGIAVLTAEQGGGCFAQGTPVLMSDGKSKAIEKVKVGDFVLTRENENNNKLVSAKVTGTHQANVSGYFILNTNLKVTASHRLWVNDSFKEVSSIKIGDTLINSQGKSVTITSIEWVNGKFEVFNLEVEKYKTYFANGVWVHNQKGNGGARVTFKDTAYWNPQIHTDLSGKAKVTFKLPDNLTTWVIAAVGSTVATQVGQTTSEVVVTKDVIVRPIMPNILRIGDEAVLSALVQNFTQSDQMFDITLKFDSGEVVGKNDNVTIKANETKQVYWRITPKQENAKSKLAFSAQSEKDPKAADTIIQEIPTKPFGFEEKRAETGEGNKTFSIKLAPDAKSEKSRITLSLASTIIGTLPTAMKYLIDYPYGCVEQTTSRFVPAVIAKANQKLFAPSIENKDLDDIIQTGLSRLSTLQQNDGGWAWWFSGRSDPYITAYVVEYVLLAKQSGVEVDEELLERAQGFLEQDEYYDYQSQQTKTLSKEDLIVKNYALTLLGSENKFDISFDLENLSPDVLALAVMANYKNGNTNPQTNGLAKLISLAQNQGDSVFWKEGNKVNFGSRDASTALAVRAILLASGDRDLAVKAARYLTRSRQSDYWSNTYATAQVIRSLVEFSKTGSELTPNYIYTVSLDDKIIDQGAVTSSNQNIKDITIPPEKIKEAGSSLAIGKSGNGQIYSTLLTSEFHTDKNTPAASHGLSVKREYVNEKGSQYSIGVGDTVIVNITLNGLKAEENYGVVNDELPSGLIPINQSFKNEQYGRNPYIDYYSYDVSDREVTENGMVLSLYRVAAGQKTYTYKARAVSEGKFKTPPATASLMYSPEIYGRSEVQTIKIAKESGFAPQKKLTDLPRKAVELLTKDKATVIQLTSALFILIVVGLFIAKQQNVTLAKVREKILKIIKKNKVQNTKDEK